MNPAMFRMFWQKYTYFSTQNLNCFVCFVRNIFCNKYINCRATNSSEKWVYKPRQILSSWLKQNIAPPRQSLWETCKFLFTQFFRIKNFLMQFIEWKYLLCQTCITKLANSEKCPFLFLFSKIHTPKTFSCAALWEK